MQPRFHRLRLNTEKFCGLLNAHPFDHSCHENNSKNFWQSIDRSLDKMQNFPLRHCSFRIVGGHRLREFDDLRFSSLHFDGIQLRGGAYTPQSLQSFIDGDPREPRNERGIAAEATETSKGVDIRFLDGILGFNVILQDTACEPVKSAIVPFHDRAERCVIAGACTPNELGIVGTGSKMLRRR